MKKDEEKLLKSAKLIVINRFWFILSGVVKTGMVLFAAYAGYQKSMEAIRDEFASVRIARATDLAELEREFVRKDAFVEVSRNVNETKLAVARIEGYLRTRHDFSSKDDPDRIALIGPDENKGQKERKSRWQRRN